MVTKNLFSKLLLVAVCFGGSTAYATSIEKEQLAQAIKQLEAVESSLRRAEQSAKTSPKTREYFNYQALRRDIEAVKRGISQYINPARAIPRDPKALRTLNEDYSKLRGQ